MKKVLFAVAMLFSSLSYSAPFLTSAPALEDVTHCVYQEGTAAPVVTPAVQAAPSQKGQCRVDLAGVSAGAHTLMVWFRNDVWGVDSAKVPFDFTRPVAGGTGPAGLVIVK